MAPIHSRGSTDRLSRVGMMRKSRARGLWVPALVLMNLYPRAWKPGTAEVTCLRGLVSFKSHTELDSRITMHSTVRGLLCPLDYHLSSPFPSLHPSTRPFTHPFICPPICPLSCLSIHLTRTDLLLSASITPASRDTVSSGRATAPGECYVPT